MKNRIVSSESSLKRQPLLAFFLSFLFTGLGQIYNGDFSKGIVLFAFRILSFIVIPLYAVLNPNSASVIIILISALVHLLAWIIASIEAYYSARNKDAYNLKKYNNFFVYIIYSLISSGLLIFSIFLNMSFFSIEGVGTDSMNPVFLNSEYVLVNKYAANNVDIGDIVLYSLYDKKDDKKLLGRVLSKEGDIVSKKGNDFYINDTALPYSIFTEDEVKKFSLKNSEDLFYEINGNKKYPVKLSSKKNIKKNQALSYKPVFVKKNELMIVFDNRTNEKSHEVIKNDMIIGRVEGIVFSENFQRILIKPYSITE